MEEIRVKFLIDLFEKRPPRRQTNEEAYDVMMVPPRQAFIEEPVVRHATREVYTEAISSAPGAVHLHHTTQDTDTAKTTFTLPLQTIHTKNATEGRTIQVHKTTHEPTIRDVPTTHQEASGLNRVRELEEQLKMRQHENDKLRNDSRAMSNKLESMELANERLRKDYEIQRRESAMQLSAMNERFEETARQLHNYQKEIDDVKAVKDGLVKEKLSNYDHEKRLNDANARIAELLRHIAQKEEHNDGGVNEKLQVELEKERLLKFELVKNLSFANEKISILEKQIEDLGTQYDHKENSAHRQVIRELSSEKRLRMEYETRLDEVKKELDRELQLKHKEEERGKLIDETLTELSEERQTRIEQEKLLNVTKHRVIALGKRLEEVENELEKTKKQLAKERLAKRNQAELLSDANKKLSGLCDKLNEKQIEQNLNGDERGEMRVFGDEILYITTKNQGDINSVSAVTSLSFDFPDSSNSSHPLDNLHVGSHRPKRKKNHPSLFPVMGAPPPKDSSPTNSDSDDLIHF